MTLKNLILVIKIVRIFWARTNVRKNKVSRTHVTRTVKPVKNIPRNFALTLVIIFSVYRGLTQLRLCWFIFGWVGVLTILAIFCHTKVSVIYRFSFTLGIDVELNLRFNSRYSFTFGCPPLVATQFHIEFHKSFKVPHHGLY